MGGFYFCWRHTVFPTVESQQRQHVRLHIRRILAGPDAPFSTGMAAKRRMGAYARRHQEETRRGRRRYA
eukprot:76153-Rhodomonas_salina.3